MLIKFNIKRSICLTDPATYVTLYNRPRAALIPSSLPAILCVEDLHSLKWDAK